MNNQNIKEIIEKFLQLLSISYTSVDVVDEKHEQSITFMIRTDDSPLLIGSHGESLMALSHLIHRVVGKKSVEGDTQPFFVVDVNEYQTRKLDALKQNAHTLAEKVRTFKVDVEMEPQTSYERMVVHSLFVGDVSVKTESVGFGPTRHIVIKYRDSS